jgi:hypothetical protein
MDTLELKNVVCFFFFFFSKCISFFSIAFYLYLCFIFFTVWAIIHKRLPHLFNSVSNDSQGNHGDNCNSFSLSKKEENAIAQGQSKTFVSPNVPKYPSWWDTAQKFTSPVNGHTELDGLKRAGGFGPNLHSGK